MADISKITLPSGDTYDVKDASAVTNITRSGTTFTATKRDGTTFTFTQQDNNTDTLVTQTNTTGDADYRVLLSLNANDTTETKGARKSTKFKANPSTGAFTATSFNGSGASLTSLNASNVSSGTLAKERLATSGATAGSYGDSAAQTPGHGGTFKVPYVTVDTYGRVTSISEHTVTIPGSDNTDTTYSAGTGLSLSGTTINHSNSVTAGTAGTSSATSGSTLAVPYITYDAQGHITGKGTHTHTVTGFLTSSSTLDATKLSGTVPTASLPSYVDDVLEYTAKSSFPATGETGKIYVDTTTNLTYRWGGSAYVEISPSLALGSTASTAAKGNHTHSVTATGTVSQPTFSGTAATISVSKSYTPAGSVAAPTFTGTKASGLTVSPASSGTATYTPAGGVSQPTFSGTAATISSSASYTPAGSVSTPTISVKTAGSTTTVNSITAVGTLPTFSTSVTDEVLSFSFSQGTLPTKGSNTTVKTGDAAYQSTQPTFTGTAATISSSASYTPAGTVSKPTFTGTGTRLILQDYTPAGTNSAPAFTGTAATITSTGSYTPAGTVSQPSFTGNAVTTGTPA